MRTGLFFKAFCGGPGQKQTHKRTRAHTPFLLLAGPFSRSGVCVLSHSVVSDSLRPHGLWPARLLCPWDFPGKNTEVGCHFLFRGIFPN